MADVVKRQDKTLFTLGPLLNGVGGIYTKYLSIYPKIPMLNV